jgi:hypothetical protein
MNFLIFRFSFHAYKLHNHFLIGHLVIFCHQKNIGTRRLDIGFFLEFFVFGQNGDHPWEDLVK